ncbi:unnamed protein product [marine sediment metagenome]|uniref:Uncharacterized protein n=1 Tax=marine sediment metagenome TaxID=412755 RepID=X0WMC3_9ZZZZ
MSETETSDGQYQDALETLLGDLTRLIASRRETLEAARVGQYGVSSLESMGVLPHERLNYVWQLWGADNDDDIARVADAISALATAAVATERW